MASICEVIRPSADAGAGFPGNRAQTPHLLRFSKIRFPTGDCVLSFLLAAPEPHSYRTPLLSGEGLSPAERKVWHEVQHLLKQRQGIKITLPDWWAHVANGVYAGSICVRRYYPAFVEACRTVCLIRSFLGEGELCDGELVVDFEDYAITALIFEKVFVQSLHLQKGDSLETQRTVSTISFNNHGAPVRAEEFARSLGIPIHRAYAKLSEAEQAGAIRRANSSGKNNRKLYLPALPQRFLPDMEDLLQALEGVESPVRLVHPISGAWVTFRRSKKKSG